MNSNYVNVMLDLETLGTKPGCKILQIGACTFEDTPSSRNLRQTFEVTIDRVAQSRLVEDGPTLDWWEKQDVFAKLRVFGGKTFIGDAFKQFGDWISELKTQYSSVPGKGADIIIWGNGATFDAPILGYAMEQYGYVIPWNFRKERCFRTLAALEIVEAPDFVGLKHTALTDAVYQAEYAEKIFTQLRGGR